MFPPPSVPDCVAKKLADWEILVLLKRYRATEFKINKIRECSDSAGRFTLMFSSDNYLVGEELVIPVDPDLRLEGIDFQADDYGLVDDNSRVWRVVKNTAMTPPCYEILPTDDQHDQIYEGSVSYTVGPAANKEESGGHGSKN